MTPSYLAADGSLPEDAEKAKRSKRQPGGISGVMDSCAVGTQPIPPPPTPEEADYALSEVHLEICGSHIGGKNLAFKVMRQATPALNEKGRPEFVKKCESSPGFTTSTTTHLRDLKSLLTPWPFAQWGLDILGPFPIAGQRKFIIARHRLLHQMGGGPGAKITRTQCHWNSFASICWQIRVP
ncbi:hypothetical protein Nepgr_006163 [Nepenthes gracilis]|uniref:Uncharacterized protein n=1 Tax=Nepenthes gracilis TaxID=150966 RepID=A0AAD3S4I7_NEPGR|nr:hypothetical protein Nepgr_006163 [Nepenthes gracilis]